MTFPSIEMSDFSDTDYTTLKDVELTSDEEDQAIDQLEQDYFGKDKLPEIEPIYESDTSDEEHENTVGNIPMRWYEEYDHIGYNRDGEKISKAASSDQVDKFLQNADDADIWKSVFDEMAGKNVVLTKKDLEIINRIQKQQYPEGFDPYEPLVEFFSSQLETMPLSSAPEPKRRFVPSKHEAKKIMKIARAIRKGYIKPVPEPKERVYDLWKESGESLVNHVPAPKMKLPGNEESYNPPEEYLKTQQEIEQEGQLQDEPVFIPKKYSSLRLVPAYDKFIQERFERCLDLYLCPRAIKQKINIDPNTLLPNLPDPKDLEPYPQKLALVYQGHTDKVLGIASDPKGYYLATISKDCTLKLWQTSTARLVKSIQFDQEPSSVCWNPNKNIHMLTVSVGNQVILMNPLLESKKIIEATNQVLSTSSNEAKSAVKWNKPSQKQLDQGYRVIIELPKQVSSIKWHKKGDYFSTLCSDSSILVHQISKKASQQPFSKSKGLVVDLSFHPSKPFFFVATQRNIRIYNLLKQELVKKLVSGVKWISSMDIHPSGDHVIIGSFDRKLAWFDLDLSSAPYKTLRYNQQAVRSVKFHSKHPLFASCSDDGSVNILHGMVYSDLMTNPLIVPLKKLKSHESRDGLGCIALDFHPVQPWIFTGGADGLVKLFS